MSGSVPEVLPCPEEEREAALEVLYRHLPAAVRPQQMAQVLGDAGRGDLDLSGLWIARRRGRVIGALLTLPLAGRAAAVWAPEVRPGWDRAAVAAGLVRAALAELGRRGFRLAQALPDDSQSRRAAADLIRGGLPRVTELVYLARTTATPLAVDSGVPRWTWRTYDAEAVAEFREVLQATYAGSLDMPELEGVRSLDDVLASHRAGGRFSPDHWRIGRLPGEPETAVIVLLSDLPDRDAWEVAYLGLTPSARGRGLGRAALAHCLDLARPRAPRLELAVDIRNRPAALLYRAAGFTPFARRSVHLTVLGGDRQEEGLRPDQEPGRLF